ncbi:hypothetical protein DL96DRAFT_1172700 [Flagelloscypha sp. PMI_526]|nr:hypothetical protein DL96DRAFT_1172700 [Flagelloscypha sp. PMI_526]
MAPSYFDRAKASLKANGGGPALVTSFVVLHELTALVPLVGIFALSRSLGLGDTIVHSLLNAQSSTFPQLHRSLVSVVDEGKVRAARIGSHYGIFGFQKGQPSSQMPDYIAGDVANAVVAYAAVKVCRARVELSFLAGQLSQRPSFHSELACLCTSVHPFPGTSSCPVKEQSLTGYRGNKGNYNGKFYVNSRFA